MIQSVTSEGWIRFNGGTLIGEQKISYQLEYAQQDAENATTSYSADYLLAEIGSSFSGVNVKLAMNYSAQMMVITVFRRL